MFSLSSTNDRPVWAMELSYAVWHQPLHCKYSVEDTQQKERILCFEAWMRKFTLMYRKWKKRLRLIIERNEYVELKQA